MCIYENQPSYSYMIPTKAAKTLITAMGTNIRIMIPYYCKVSILIIYYQPEKSKLKEK